jgi:NTE family protein
MQQTPDGVRIGLVLSAGGLRGAAHVGVLRALVRHAIPVDVIVGVSAGAVIGAYYAAVGLEVDDLIADARLFRGRHLLTHSLNVQLGGRFDSVLGPRCGVIPDRLRRLEAAGFDALHHSVHGLGIVCHDVSAGEPRYFATGSDHGARLYDVVRASASIPYLFPPRPFASRGERWLLTDGGVSDPVPLGFARQAPLAATHLIVSDCRWIGSPPAPVGNVVWIRPRLASTGTLWAPRQGLLSAVRQGEAAVTEEVIACIRAWAGASRQDAPEVMRHSTERR